jgi:hypothetical protein
MNATMDQLWTSVYEMRAAQAAGENDDEDVSNAITKLNQCNGSTGEIALLRGYIAYHFVCEATKDIDVEFEFRSVLNGDPRNTTARLYLAHYYFDSGRYSDALKYLEQIDREEYNVVGQKWRALKIEEMSLAARIHLSVETVPPDDVVEFAKELHSDGVENAAIPSELVDCLLTNRSSVLRAWSPSVLRSVVTHLRKAIDEIGGTSLLKDKTDRITTEDLLQTE